MDGESEKGGSFTNLMSGSALSSGERVPDQGYFRHRSLRRIVTINQLVTLAARSLIKEKGSSMMGAL